MGGRLDSKIVIACGAGSSSPGDLSNGMASAVIMAREGAKVFAVDIDIDHMKETKARIEADGGECTLYRCDVSSRAEVEAMVENCRRTYGGKIDVLFNNVGVNSIGGPPDVSEDDFDRVMRINVKSMYLTCRSVIPVMLEQGGGAIVNTSSVAGIRFAYPSFTYAASKGAVNQLTQNIAGTYAARGIRCNSVVPGYILAAGSLGRMRRQFGDNFEQQVRERARQVPCGKLGEPWDVGYAVLFLASEEAKYITGVNLVVDGGQSCSVTGRVSEWEGFSS
jgi:NAD(P)-dependent dehydrogenase (short-subunit alcohol dehydrogenase family)